jgi:hypothetical protein
MNQQDLVEAVAAAPVTGVMSYKPYPRAAVARV